MAERNNNNDSRQSQKSTKDDDNNLDEARNLVEGFQRQDLFNSPSQQQSGDKRRKSSSSKKDTNKNKPLEVQPPLNRTRQQQTFNPEPEACSSEQFVAKTVPPTMTVESKKGEREEQ